MTDKVELINDFYTRILSSIGLMVTPEGRVEMSDGNGGSLPVTIDKKYAYIPTRAVMSKFDKEAMLAWHPLSENTLRGESELIKRTKRFVLYKMTSDLHIVTVALAEIAADHQLHAKMTPEQNKFLAIAGDADAKTCTRLHDFWKATYEDDNDFIRLFLNRGGTVNGQKYTRTATVTFQHLDLLFPAEDEKPRDSILDVPLRKVKPNDLKCWSSVIEYVLPAIRVKDAYTGVAETGETPYFVALMTAFLKFSHRINAVAGMFMNLSPALVSVIKDLDWEEDLLESSKWIGVIPNLDVSSVVVPETKPSVSTTSQQEISNQRSRLVDPEPNVAVAPARSPDAPAVGLASPEEIMARLNPRPTGYQAVNAPQYPNGNGYPQAPNGYYAQPGYGQPQVACDPYGRPLPPPAPLDQYGRPLPMGDVYGRPMQPAPVNNGYSNQPPFDPPYHQYNGGYQQPINPHSRAGRNSR